MRRTIGDIYAIRLPDERVGFLQHIANDESQLGSNVVRVFDSIQAKETIIDLEAIAKSEVKFYAHVLLKAGETLSVWEKIGRVKNVSASIPLWCKCTDMDWRVPISENWLVWRTDEPTIRAVLDSSDFLEAEIGIVFSPNDIRTRLIDGKYGGVYPRKPA